MRKIKPSPIHDRQLNKLLSTTAIPTYVLTINVVGRFLKNSLPFSLLCIALVALLLVGDVNMVNAQTIEPCGTQIMLEQAKLNDPTLNDGIQNIENEYSQFLYEDKNGNSNLLRQKMLMPSNSDEIIIPVVVHIFHNSSDAYGINNNIPYTQIQAQILALNNAFANNPNIGQSGLQVNTKIKFCLAQTAMGVSNTGVSTTFYNNGTTTEYGVKRYPVPNLAGWNLTLSSTASLLNSYTHPSNAISPYFPFEKYFNIWVLPTLDGALNGLMGISSFPFQNSEPYDGIFIRTDVFGNGQTMLNPNFNKGKILAHEVGHYLGLYHTFTDDCFENTVNDPLAGFNYGDHCPDTPPSMLNYYNCTNAGTPPNFIPPCGNLTPTLHYEDYMSYAYNNCMNSFTGDQNTRMRFYLNAYRKKLYSNSNLIATGLKPNGCVAATLFSEFTYTGDACINSLQSFTAVGTIGNLAGSTASNYTWTFAGGTPATFTGLNPSVSFTGVGPHLVTLTVHSGTQTISSTQTIDISNCTISNGLENSHWYFGDFAALDFSPTNGQPHPNSIAGPPKNTLFSAESSVSVSDNAGNLQFYSNGYEVWNNLHFSLNPNSTNWIYGCPKFIFVNPVANCGGNGSESQQTLIPRTCTDNHSNSSISQLTVIPIPGAPKQYFIFKPPYLDDDVNNTHRRLGYAKIDMNLPRIPGSGSTTDMGQIVENDYIDLGSNVNLSEMITAIKGCNNEWWIICRGAKNRMSGLPMFTDNKYYVFKVSGPNLGLVNHVLPSSANLTSYNSSYPIYFHGQLKASPDGSKLALVSSENSASKPNLKGILVTNFNNINGAISNEILLQVNPVKAFNSISFSPNSNYLFASTLYTYDNIVTVFTPQALLQFDLTAPVANWPVYNNVNSNYTNYGRMQLAPNGRIYMPMSNSSPYKYTAIASITNPNIYPTTSFVADDINANLAQLYTANVPESNRYIKTLSNLPSINDAWNPSAQPISISVSKTTCTDITCVLNSCTPQTVTWDFGDGTTQNLTTTATSNSIVHTYLSAGTKVINCYSGTTLLGTETILIGPLSGNLTFSQASLNATCTKFQYTTNPGLGTYQWDVVGGLIIDPLQNGVNLNTIYGTNLNSVTIQWNSSGLRTFTVTCTQGGCTYTGTFTFNNSSLVTITETPPTLCGQTEQLAATLACGAAPYTYAWSPTATIIGASNTQTISVQLVPQTYTVVITDANNTTYTNSITVAGNANIYTFGNTITSADIANANSYQICSIPVNTTITGNVTFLNKTVLIAKNVTINVAANTTLEINNSHFKSCDYLWEGITANSPNTIVKVIGNSLIEDAKRAVYLNRYTGYHFENAIFNKNQLAIEFSNGASNASPAILRATIITNRVLPSNPTYANLSAGAQIGSVLDNYSQGTLLPIYQATPSNLFSAGIIIRALNSQFNVGEAITAKANIFDNLHFGVYAINAGTKLYNNVFRRITDLNGGSILGSDGCGLYSEFTGSAASAPAVTVGGALSTQYNYFDNVLSAILVKSASNVNIQYNKLGTYNLCTNCHRNGIGLFGQYLNTATISNNTINYYEYGIWVNRFFMLTSGIINIEKNNISGIISGNSTRTGIAIEQTTNQITTGFTQPINIKCNTISNQFIGIKAANITSGLVIENNPQVTYPIGQANAKGIYITGCRGALIKNNGWNSNTNTSIGGDSFSGGTAYTSPIGILIENSKSTNLTKNRIRCAANAITYRGDCGAYGSTGNLMRDNDLNYYTYGITLEKIVNTPSGTGVIASGFYSSILNNYTGTSAPAFSNRPPTGNLLKTNAWPQATLYQTYVNQVQNTWGNAEYSPMVVTTLTNEQPNSNLFFAPGIAFASTNSNNLYFSGNVKPSVTYSNCGIINTGCCPPDTPQNEEFDENQVLKIIDDVEELNAGATVAELDEAWLKEQSLYKDLKYTNEAIDNPMLQAFYDQKETEAIGLFLKIDKFITEGNYTQAQEANAALSINNEIEAKVQKYYFVYLDYMLKGDTLPMDSSFVADLQNIANLCKDKYGDIVLQARALNNAIMGMPIDYGDPCIANSRVAREQPVEVTAIEVLEVEENNDETVRLDSEILLLPNPNAGIFTINLPNLKYQHLQFAIVNATGQFVKTVNVSNSKLNHELDCKELPNGLYNLIVKADGIPLHTTKFIIHR